jgi:hypothetical protein
LNKGPIAIDIRQREGLPAAIGVTVAVLLGVYVLLTSTVPLSTRLELLDVKRILQFGLLALIMIAPVLSAGIRAQIGELFARSPTWLTGSLATFFVWGALSALVNAESWLQFANSLSDVALLALLLPAVCIVAGCRNAAGIWFDRVALGALALTGIAVGLQELTGVFAALQSGTEFNYWISLIYFAHPRFFNQVQTWMIPVLVALPLVFPRNRLVYSICFLSLALNWFVVLMTGARGSFLAITIAVFAAVAIYPAVRSRLLRWQTAGLLGGAAIYAAVMLSFAPSEGSGLDRPAELAPRGSTAEDTRALEYVGDVPGEGNRFLANSLGRPLLHPMGRIEMWKRSAGDALANPLFGIGPMAYACTQTAAFAHPHNFPMQIAAEWGLPAAFLLCTVIAVLFWRAATRLLRDRTKHSRDLTFAALLFASAIAATLHACLSGVLVMPASQVVGLLVCGMLTGEFAAGRGQAQVVLSKSTFLAPALLSFLLLALGGHELRTMDERAVLLPPDIKHPRMWQNAFVCRVYTTEIPVTK